MDLSAIHCNLHRHELYRLQAAHFGDPNQLALDRANRLFNLFMFLAPDTLLDNYQEAAVQEQIKQLELQTRRHELRRV